MTTATSLRWTPLASADVDAWAELIAVLAQADGTDELYQADDLAEELREVGVIPEHDTWAVWDGGLLVGYGQLRVSLTTDHEGRARCHLSGGVHPQSRRRGIGTALMDRMERRALALARERHPGVTPYLRAPGQLDGSDTRRFLRARGYGEVRYFDDLSRQVPDRPIPMRDVEGVRLVGEDALPEEAVRAAHNAAFRDHWGSADITAEQWHHFATSRSSRPSLSSVAVAPDGSVQSYVLTGEHVPRTLYVEIVGTVPRARGRGLAALCLTRTLNLAAGSGEYDTVRLDVDSDSPTGATRLYERLGFRTVRTMAAMQREVD